MTGKGASHVSIGLERLFAFPRHKRAAAESLRDLESFRVAERAELHGLETHDKRGHGLRQQIAQLQEVIVPRPAGQRDALEAERRALDELLHHFNPRDVIAIVMLDARHGGELAARALVRRGDPDRAEYAAVFGVDVRLKVGLHVLHVAPHHRLHLHVTCIFHLFFFFLKRITS